MRPLLALALVGLFLSSCHASRGKPSRRFSWHSEVKTSSTGGTVERKRSHEQAAIDPDDLCIKESVLSFDDLEVARQATLRGWMTQHDWGKEINKLNRNTTKFVRIGIDGFPCAKHGCCQHHMSIRLDGSDWFVVQNVINEYASYLRNLLPWKPKVILEGGGNIGVATSLFAFMYPDAKIIVLEPEPENCELLKKNTKPFSNVVIECVGLWAKEDTSVRLYAGGDGASWAWRLEEVPQGTTGAVKTTSVPALLKKYDVDGFDMAKIDIEGAEFSVFGADADKSWVKKSQVMMLELHGSYGDIDAIRGNFTADGFTNSKSGEYDIFTRPGVLLPS